MASTNKTPHYNLSQYIANDKPTYLGDYNTDMSRIDTAINNAQDSADTAATSATNAQTAAETAQTTATTAVTNAAAAQTSADSANTKIGTLANLNTTEKTNLVGAINEVNTKASTSVVVDSLSGGQTNKAPSVRSVYASVHGDVLYSNDNGSIANNINLSANVNSYKRIEIICGDADERNVIQFYPLGSAQIVSPWFLFTDNNNGTGIFSAFYSVNNTTLTYQRSARWYQYPNGSSSVDTEARVRIYKVIGYHEA